MVKTTKIVIGLDSGMEIILTKEEALELKGELDELLGNNKITTIKEKETPWIDPKPYEPWKQFQPVVIWTDSTGMTKSSIGKGDYRLDNAPMVHSGMTTIYGN